jgi:alpha-1,3-mannosyltransferase
MNILLFAPALFLLLVEAMGFKSTILHIIFCGMIQLLLGVPFLATNPIGYLQRSFELGRVFFFKWTVNWKFLDEEFFVSKTWALILLALHLLFLIVFAIKSIEWKGKHSPPRVVKLMFVCNFIGIVFCRSLHYQFYSWYYWTLPLLLWQVPLYSFVRVAILFSIEYAFNVFPATAQSSMVLQAAHASLLISLVLGIELVSRVKKDVKEE